MRKYILLTIPLLLPETNALAFDATKATRYPSPDMYRPNVDAVIARGVGSSFPALEITGPGITCAPGSACDASSLKAAGTSQIARSLAARLDDTLNIKDFGAVCDGAARPLSARFSTLAAAQLLYPAAVELSDETDWAAIQGAVNKGRPVIVPDGYCMVNRTLAVTQNGVMLEGRHRDATQIRRHGDFGPTIKFSSGPFIYNTGLRNLAFYDFGGAPGLGPAMTQANSPYEIVFDSHKNTRVENLYIGLGPNSNSDGGGISMLGSVEFYLRDVYITLDAGSSVGRHAFRLGVSQIDGAPSPGGTGKNVISSLNVEGSTFNYTNGALTSISPHVEDGIRIESGDGLWISDSHVQGTVNADLHIATKAGVQISNFHVANSMFDITNGSGVIIDGDGTLQRIDMQARLSASGIGNPGAKPGFLASAAITEGRFDLGVEGFSGVCVQSSNPNTKNVSFQLSQLTRCLGGGMLFDAGKNFSVTGGVIGGDGVTPYGIQVGAGVTGFTSSGVSAVETAPAPAGYGFILQNGASGISISGGRATANASAAVLDSTASTAKVRVTGVLGQADITKN